MKWTYSIQNKLTASAVLLLLCGLVLFSNLNDRTHTRNVKKSISTLYEDRLIAEGYILKLTDGIYQVKEVLNCQRAGQVIPGQKIDSIQADIRKHSHSYGLTKFTKQEERQFAELKKVFGEMERNRVGDIPATLLLADEALGLLSELSAIQLEESKLIMSRSEQLFNASKLSSELAFGIVVLILLVLQALVFTSKTLHISNKPPLVDLN